MKVYTCPMHPDVKSNQPGKCPKCGMKLVSSQKGNKGLEKSIWKSYIPLLVIVSLILITSLVITVNDIQTNYASLDKTISYFMIGFFLTFSAFKLMDLKGFAEGYSTYDLLAKRWFNYGYIYPFIELGFGLSMILTQSIWLLILEFLVMIFSGLGVAIKLLKKEKFQCACLGTFLKVPLTKVTLIENFGMAGLALLMLVIK